MTALRWNRARACTGPSACVDVAFAGQTAWLRDSKSLAPGCETLQVSFPLDEYQFLIEQVHRGHRSVRTQNLEVDVQEDGGATILSLADRTKLSFFSHEWSTFCAAAVNDDYKEI